MYRLHPLCRVIAAGNDPDGNYDAMLLKTQNSSRLMHFHIRVDENEWLEWAKGRPEEIDPKTGKVIKEAIPPLDSRVIAFITARPEGLSNIGSLVDVSTPQGKEWEGRTKEYGYAVPRTWTALSDILQNSAEVRDDTPKANSLLGTSSKWGHIIKATIGPEMGQAFIAFCNERSKRSVSYDDIVANPNTASFPTDNTTYHDLLTEIMGSLFTKGIKDNFAALKPITDYFKRFFTNNDVVSNRGGWKETFKERVYQPISKIVSAKAGVELDSDYAKGGVHIEQLTKEQIAGLVKGFKYMGNGIGHLIDTSESEDDDFAGIQL